MSFTPETAREHLRNFVYRSADAAVRPSESVLDAYVDQTVAAEMRALLALHPGGSLNYWVSRRAEELESLAVDQ